MYKTIYILLQTHTIHDTSPRGIRYIHAVYVVRSYSRSLSCAVHKSTIFNPTHPCVVCSMRTGYPVVCRATVLRVFQRRTQHIRGLRTDGQVGKAQMPVLKSQDASATIMPVGFSSPPPHLLPRAMSTRFRTVSQDTIANWSLTEPTSHG